MIDPLKRIEKIWNELYGNEQVVQLNQFISEIKTLKPAMRIAPLQPEWYKDAVVYSLYVDLFNKDFPGLEDKLDYLAELGVNCLWLLPILESPEASETTEMGDKLEVDLGSGEIRNITRQKVFHAKPYPGFMQAIIEKGGLIPYTKERLKSEKAP